VRIEYAVPRKKVETALQYYLKRISAHIKVHQAILFGSYAQDNYSPGSDVDIAIIADDLPSDPGKRFAMLKDTVLGLDLQPFAYTTEEWDKMLKTQSSFASEIIKHGKVLMPIDGDRRARKSYYGGARGIGPFNAEDEMKGHD
jgi:predicted nucleotidyltransferase